MDWTYIVINSPWMKLRERERRMCRVSPSHFHRHYVFLIKLNEYLYHIRLGKDTLSSFTRRRWGTVLIPWAQTAWLSFGSSRTSEVPIVFWANAMTDLTAHGARFLNERPCTCLCRWMVYSRATTSWSAERVLPPVFPKKKKKLQVSCRSSMLKNFLNLFLGCRSLRVLNQIILLLLQWGWTYHVLRMLMSMSQGWTLFGPDLLCKQSKVRVACQYYVI